MTERVTSKLVSWIVRWGGYLVAVLLGLLVLVVKLGAWSGRRFKRGDTKTDRKLDRLNAKRAKLLNKATEAEQEAIQLGHEVEANEAATKAKEERIRNMEEEELAAEYNRLFGKGK